MPSGASTRCGHTVGKPPSSYKVRFDEEAAGCQACADPLQSTGEQQRMAAREGSIFHLPSAGTGPLELGRECDSPWQPPSNFVLLLAERNGNLEGKKGPKCPASTAQTRVCQYKHCAWQTPINVKYRHTLCIPGGRQRDPLTSSLPPMAPAAPAKASWHKSPPRTQVNYVMVKPQ